MNNNVSLHLFSTLPVELTEMVCRKLPERDLQSLRLVDSLLNKSATKVLIEELNVKKNSRPVEEFPIVQYKITCYSNPKPSEFELSTSRLIALQAKREIQMKREIEELTNSIKSSSEVSIDQIFDWQMKMQQFGHFQQFVGIIRNLARQRDSVQF